jgi:hypothetical protein
MFAALTDIVFDAFQSQISRRALIGGLLAATTTALVGTWVVVRGLAFFGDALAHGVLPGIAPAAIWGFDLALGALVSALVMAGPGPRSTAHLACPIGCIELPRRGDPARVRVPRRSPSLRCPDRQAHSGGNGCCGAVRLVISRARLDRQLPPRHRSIAALA